MGLTNLLEAHIGASLEANRDDPEWPRCLEAFDVSLEPHGRAEWQVVRRERPEQFWSAKVEIQAGPKDMSCEVARDVLADAARFRFEWRRNGKVERIDKTIDRDLLYGGDSWLQEDLALRHLLRQTAHQVERHTGIKTILSVIGNREALAELRRRDEQKQKPPPTR
jgi:hypothetical protein